MAPSQKTSEIVVAAGSIIATAPAGTASPALGTAPAAPWVDLGYVSEDGVTWTESPEEETLRSWMSADPVKVVLTGLSRTFAFALMQWNPTTLGFIIGGTSTTVVGPPASGKFVPAKSGRPEVALIIRFVWETFESQIYCPRGKVTGDVDATLIRSDSANFTGTFTTTPSGTENAYELTTVNPAFASPTEAEAAAATFGYSADELETVGAGSGGKSSK